MESDLGSKLKALKVADLKELLSRAQVHVPAKANKPDLIKLIIANRAARSVFEESQGGSLRQSGASTPRPAAATSLPVDKEDAEKQRVATETKKESNILAPPEPFDWSAGAETSAETTAKPASKSATTASAKATSSKGAASASARPPAPSTSPSATQQSSQAEATEPPADEDEETKKRRERAERFGQPFIAKPSPSQTKKAPKVAAASPAAPAAATNGAGTKKAATKISAAVEEDPEKLKARAMRFGLDSKANTAKPAAGAAVAVTGQKRGPPADAIDPEEAERRRKRAERFGLAAKA